VSVVDLKIKGVPELIAKMQQLPDEVQFKIMGGATIAAANVFQEEARANVPKRSAQLERAIRVVKGNSRTKGIVGAKVVLKGRHAYLGKWMEWGTVPHLISVRRKGSLVIGGKAIGRMAKHPGIRPRPFMRPAVDNKMAEAIKTVHQFLERHLAWGSIPAVVVKADGGEE
jgi:HK97 gp10 family phage protein